jgi:hypothetical protein
MAATASTAAAVERRMAWSMLLAGYGRVIAGQRVAVGAAHAAGRSADSPMRCDRTYRTNIGPGETGAGHGLLLHDRLGGIWEVASGANHPEPLPTELKQSL